MTTGATKPAKLPHIFIAPESVPAYLPPTSIAADQALGITRSFAKLATAMLRMAVSGSCVNVDATKKVAAPANPRQEMVRRDRLTPMRRDSHDPAMTDA